MKLEEAIKHTKNKPGMKQSFGGFIKKVIRFIKINNKDEKELPFVLEEMTKHFNQAREAWLKGDLETVAEFFGLYV